MSGASPRADPIQSLAAPVRVSAPARATPHALPHTALAWTLVLALAAFQLWYIAAGAADLAPDEAQYWAWSRRLDWAYFSKDPVVAYLIAASTALGTATPFWIRLPAVLLGGGTALLLVHLARGAFARVPGSSRWSCASRARCSPSAQR